MAEKQASEKYFNSPTHGWIRAPAGATDKEIMEDLMDLGSSPKEAWSTVSKPFSYGEMQGTRIKDYGSGLAKQVGAGATELVGNMLEPFMPTTTGLDPQEAQKKGVPLQQPDDTAAALTKGIFGDVPDPGDPAQFLARNAPAAVVGGLATRGPPLARAYYGMAPRALGYLGAEGGQWLGDKMNQADIVPESWGNKVGPAAQVASTLFGPNALRGAITPAGKIPKEKIAAGKVARDAGVNVTAGNIRGDPGLLAAESSSDPTLAKQHQGQFVNAISRAAGQEANTLQPGQGGFFDTQERRLYGPSYANTPNSPYFKDLERIQVNSDQEDRNRLLGVVDKHMPNWTVKPGPYDFTRTLSRGMSARDYYIVRSGLVKDAASAGAKNPRYSAMVNDVVGAMDKAFQGQNLQPAGAPSWASQEEQNRILKKTFENTQSPSPTPKQVGAATQQVSGFPRVLNQTAPSSQLIDSLKLMTENPEGNSNYWSHRPDQVVGKGLLGGAAAAAYTHATGGAEPWLSFLGGATAGGMLPYVGNYLKSKVALTAPYQAWQENQALPFSRMPLSTRLGIPGTNLNSPIPIPNDWATIQALMMKSPTPSGQPPEQAPQ